VKQPNVVFVFDDQHAARNTGYTGDPNLAGKTPAMDALAAGGTNCVNAVSGTPLCTPYRASLITGQYPQTHGLFLNDVCLRDNGNSIAHCFSRAGYDTAYIGKWHIDGHGRSAYIPPERRQGFDYWQVLECTHNYMDSRYYDQDCDAIKTWDGYDAFAQTRAAMAYIAERPKDVPFLLMLSWGPPHDPFDKLPEPYKSMFPPESIILPPDVPEENAETARKNYSGYYGHIAAIDDCLSQLLSVIDGDTIFVFTSDHGTMTWSKGIPQKQVPYDGSVHVPFLLKLPERLGAAPRTIAQPINTPDIMPTLLDLCGIAVPETVEGTSFAALLHGNADNYPSSSLIQCMQPIAHWNKRNRGGVEYRGVRTERHTYVRSIRGPWLLYDNIADPWQMDNLINNPARAGLQAELEQMLTAHLERRGDEFLTGEEYAARWGYTLDEYGTVPITF
jgi:arylsulfatase A-like enzyme